MDDERWRRIEEFFHHAADLAPIQRAEYLSRACAGDDELRRQVESLLARDNSKENVVEAAVAQAVDQLPADSRAESQAPLAVGTRLGPYEILAPIGKGGMGEVYKARDPRMDRDVAIKVSAEQFSERFSREVRAVAALNHPNICTLYDVGTNYLVMELIEGPTLADRIKEGPVPIEEALEIARQIADALDAAHEKNVVHRDLKPSNVKIKPDGTVKVLDFGLAKIGDTLPDHVDDSPTLTMRRTLEGAILGTAAYMSPEQARGKPVDKRADIWAFGVVLYEMLTGRRLFQGETTTDVLAAVVNNEPDWVRVPPKVQRLLRRCLERDPQKRLRHLGDAMELIERAPTHRIAVLSRRKWPWVGAGFAVMLVAAALGWILKPAPEQQPMLQLEISPPDGVKFEATITPFALSPDGRRLVFVATDKSGRSMLWLRLIDSSSATALAGTENAAVPFWSPDSRWVGFSANGKLQKLDVVAGGQPQIICDIEGRAGGTWNRDGVVVFDQGTKPLQRVSADGGAPTPILQLATQETTQQAPYFLPDGRHLVYFSVGQKGVKIMLASLGGEMNRMLIEGAAAVTYAPNPRGGGSLLYNARGQLLARPFDLAKLEFSGQPAVIADGVGSARWWYPSANGLLAFRHNYGSQFQLAWFGRDGRTLGMLGDPGELSAPRISPDQKTIAFQRTSQQNTDVWTLDLTRNTSARFTFEPGLDGWPIWSYDGSGIIYASRTGMTSGPYSVVERPVNGADSERVVARPGGYNLAPTAVSRDGRWVVVMEASAVHSVVTLRSREDARKVVRIQEHDTENDGSISPDGRWLLYSSTPAGRREVLVQSMPKEAGGLATAVGKWQISTAGGSQPAWRADGKEIFYVAPDRVMMAVPVEFGEDFFRPGAPKPLFQTHLEFDPALSMALYQWVRQYDVTADGQRFLLNQHVADSTDAPITVVVNWPKLLTK